MPHLLQSSRRIVLLALAGLTIATAQAADEDIRQTTTAFLADEAPPTLTLPESLRPAQPPEEWQGQEVVCLPLSGGHMPKAGYVVTEKEGARVLGFMAPRPEGPVPAEEMPREQAGNTAREFAQRHLPELFAGGGEVQTTAGDGITPYGAYLFALQRMEQGFQVPTRATVRIYVDGTLEGTAADITTGDFACTAPVTIGAYLWGANSQFAEALIDDVEIKRLGRLEDRD